LFADSILRVKNSKRNFKRFVLKNNEAGLCKTLAALAELAEPLFRLLPFMGLNQVTFRITQLLYLNNHNFSGKYSGVAFRNKKLCSIPTTLFR
tara:strand:+ start:3386 stop:3664 length:279 start_codon:yes stop_codon:yes gene_type:complete